MSLDHGTSFHQHSGCLWDLEYSESQLTEDLSQTDKSSSLSCTRSSGEADPEDRMLTFGYDFRSVQSSLCHPCFMSTAFADVQRSHSFRGLVLSQDFIHPQLRLLLLLYFLVYHATQLVVLQLTVHLFVLVLRGDAFDAFHFDFVKLHVLGIYWRQLLLLHVRDWPFRPRVTNTRAVALALILSCLDICHLLKGPREPLFCG